MYIISINSCILISMYACVIIKHTTYSCTGMYIAIHKIKLKYFSWTHMATNLAI